MRRTPDFHTWPGRAGSYRNVNGPVAEVRGDAERAAVHEKPAGVLIELHADPIEAGIGEFRAGPAQREQDGRMGLSDIGDGREGGWS